MSDIACPHCAGGIMSEQTYASTVNVGERAVEVQGLRKFVCSSCSGGLVSRAQMKANDLHIGEHIQYTSGL